LVGFVFYLRLRLFFYVLLSCPEIGLHYLGLL